MKTVAVVQARMASARLPGKVLKELGSKKAIDWAYEAAKRAIGVDEVVVATSVNPENDELVDYATGMGYRVIRGSEDDVLQRYCQVIKETAAINIVRLTADCPFLDSRVISEVIALKEAAIVPYASNIDPPTWPDGLDCEVIFAGALLTADREAKRKTDRDTVTQWIVRNRHRYPQINLSCPIPGMHKERWVLDSPEDYIFCQSIFAQFPPDWVPNYLDIHNLLQKRPELRMKELKYTRNQRFFEALATEEPIGRTHTLSKDLLKVAEDVIPLGAQTFSKSKLQYPAEAPLFVTYGNGGLVYDVEGQEYVDLVGGLLPNILGYRDPDVDFAIRRQLDAGISFSLATELEQKLAFKLKELIPCAEMSRFGKNGTDACAAAIRLARLCTGRSKVLTSGYHGWVDWAVAHDPVRSGGTLRSDKEHVTPLEHGSVVMANLYLRSREYACVIVEPEHDPEFLAELRKICDETGTLLVFDEIITGFRVHLGGAQSLWGVTPDLATFGKAMGNGMPISALVGKKNYMGQMPRTSFSGTFFGETLSLAAALATIDKLEREDVIAKLRRKNEILYSRVARMMSNKEKFITLSGNGLLRVSFSGKGGFSKEQIKTLFIQEMLAWGVLIIASNNFCYAHSDSDMERITNAYRYTIDTINDGIFYGNLQEKIKGSTIQASANVRN